MTMRKSCGRFCRVGSERVEEMTLAEILEATGGRLLKGEAGVAVSGISTDTRSLRAGDLFIPLKGENFDGHRFLEEAF